MRYLSRSSFLLLPLVVACGSSSSGSDKAPQPQPESSNGWKEFDAEYVKSCNENLKATLTPAQAASACACTLSKMQAKPRTGSPEDADVSSLLTKTEVTQCTEQALASVKPTNSAPGTIQPPPAPPVVAPPAPVVPPAPAPVTPLQTVTSKLQGTWASDSCNKRYESTVPFARKPGGGPEDLIVANGAFYRYKLVVLKDTFELKMRLFYLNYDACLKDSSEEDNLALELTYSGTFSLSGQSGQAITTTGINDIDYSINKVSMRSNSVWKDSAKMVCGIAVSNDSSIAKSYDVTGSVCDPKVIFDIIDASGSSLYLGNRYEADDAGRVLHGWTKNARPVKIDILNGLKKVP